MALPAKSWTANAWLLLFGLGLVVGLVVVGPQGFLALVRAAYLGPAAEREARFSTRLEAETLVLYGVLAGLGGLALIAAALGSMRGQSVAGRLWGGGTPGWRESVLLAALGYSSLLVGARVSRDVLRGIDLAGRGFEARRAALLAEDPRELDYPKALAFLERARQRPGNLIVVMSRRGGRMRGQMPLYAAYLFPKRLYAARSLECRAPEPTEHRLAERGIAWVQYDCRDDPFEPWALEAAK